MSDTPRTDKWAKSYAHYIFPVQYDAMRDHAETLERELAAATARVAELSDLPEEVAQLRTAIRHYKSEVERLTAHAESAERELRSVKQAEPVASPVAPPDKIDWMEGARMRAAQCWCEPETSGIEMDVRLAESVAKAIAGWMQEAAQYAKNADYWRTLCSASAPAPDGWVTVPKEPTEAMIAAYLALNTRFHSAKADWAAMLAAAPAAPQSLGREG